MNQGVIVVWQDNPGENPEAMLPERRQQRRIVEIVIMGMGMKQRNDIALLYRIRLHKEQQSGDPGCSDHKRTPVTTIPTAPAQAPPVPQYPAGSPPARGCVAPTDHQPLG